MHKQLFPDLTITPQKPLLIAGPCVVESEALCKQVVEQLIPMAEKAGFSLVFKASFEKANRTSGQSFRSIGIDKALSILAKIRTEYGVHVITDVHESSQVASVAQAVDMLQIPAFLCRQTELLLACGETGLPVNIKKGQFMAPQDMHYAVQKIESTGNFLSLLTERGSFFGYGNLVVDYRSLPIMRAFAPVIFDVTHSVQLPGAGQGVSGGNRYFASYLARAAAAAGVDGFFIETHPNPDQAWSDGPNMIPLHELEAFLMDIQKVRWIEGETRP